jgi:hypothetical protein
MVPAACLVAADAVAQSEVEDVRDLVRELARGSGLGDQLLGLSGFAALPGISAATFDTRAADGSDADIVRLILPLARQLGGPRLLGGLPYLEGTLGYSRTTQSGLIDPGGALETRIDASMTTLSALAGAGLGFELLPGTVLRPIALLGYAHLDDDTDFSGRGTEALEPVLDDILANFTADELLYGAALEVVRERPLGALNLSLNARYNHLWGTTLRASDEALDGSSDFGVLTAAATLDGPLPATTFGRELRWLAFATNSSFPGLSGDALGFDYFFELGGGLEIVDRAAAPGVEGLSLRASYILGDNVTGFSLGAHVEF